MSPVPTSNEGRGEGEVMPKPPKGFAACRVSNGEQKLITLGATIQVSHLVALNDKGSNGGRPTVCGLTRFPDRAVDGHTVIREADLAGWSMGGGISGPGVTQMRCPDCWLSDDELAKARAAIATPSPAPVSSPVEGGPAGEFVPTREALEALPEWTVVAIGKRLPSGGWNRGMYVRTRTGLRSISPRRDDDPANTMHHAVTQNDVAEIRSPATPPVVTPEDGRREVAPAMHIIRRADGEEMGEFAFFATDGPDDWDVAANYDHDDDTVYEILACYPVARRKILCSTICPLCDGEGEDDIGTMCPSCGGSGEHEPPDAEHTPIAAFPAAPGSSGSGDWT